MWEDILWFLQEYTEESGTAGFLLVFAGGVLTWLKRARGKSEKLEISDASLEKLSPQKGKMDVIDFIRIRKELKADLEAELAAASEDEQAQLRARIAELENQIAHPDEALVVAQKRIADLEDILERSGNQIGGERIAQAKAALETGDYSIADEIFAEIEARNDMAVQESARAAFGRGEVAEAEVRWGDAAHHYFTAAKRHESYGHLFKASLFLWRAGRYNEALVYSTQLVGFAEDNASQEDLASAYNENGVRLHALGRFSEAEDQFQKALKIGRATIGDQHPDFANYLNNLAKAVRDQGRHAEAEGLYLQALEIGRATIGEQHPDYAVRLNNLAGVVFTEGRLTEAEGLFRQALEISRKTLGDQHPDHATWLNNLAVLNRDQGKYEEARALWEQALTILQATLPADHPHIASVERSLANLPPPAD